jgi:YHS domain-containing protein
MLRSPIKRRYIMTAAICLAVSGAAAFAVIPSHSGEIYTGFMSNAAIGGYDAVAYVTIGKPVEGLSSIATQWKGATWRFASEANRTAFLADPERYAPQYGGHCSWAAAQGYPAKGDPQNWKLVNGKLYLNYDASVQAKWEKDIPGFIVSADAKWPSVKPK